MSNLCRVIFQSEKGQLILLSSLMDMVNESDNGMKALNLDFMKDLMDANDGMLSAEANAMLQEKGFDATKET